MFSSIKLWITLGIIGILGLAGWAAWYYYQDTQDRLAIMSANLATTELVVETQAATITKMVETATRNQMLTRELQEELANTEDHRNDLLKILQDHDLTRLAVERPGLIERRINDATDEIFDALESDTLR